MKLPDSKETAIVIKEANKIARKLGQNFVGSEHLIVALASVADTTAYSILNENGLDISKIIDALKYTLEPGGVITGERDKYTKSARQILDGIKERYGSDINPALVRAEAMLSFFEE